ncbi:hypothetical protein MCUN1_002379a [Malassezia cuniculi]|uniref:Uncharacterized protein n=1 Tax=Malassezia cuniculi TaxID=948313 RepID=A0AAF0EVN1_9BASI|nr:hypothetical protein MCUN1_002379a [Malassezia cuniculi]
MNPNFDMIYSPDFTPLMNFAKEQPEQPTEQEYPHEYPPVVVNNCTIA